MKDGVENVCKACRRLAQRERDAAAATTPAKKESSNEKKICKNPDCSLAGHPQPIDNFQKTRGGLRWGTCRDCAKKKRQQNKQKSTASKSTKKTTTPISSAVGTNDYQIRINIVIDIPDEFPANLSNFIENVVLQAGCKP